MNIKKTVISSLNNKAAFLTPVGVSELGTMVIDNVVFPALKGEITDINGDPITYPKLSLDDAQLTVNRGKRIVKSVINGQGGTVKEYITLDDYSISLVGSINSIIGFPANKWQAFVDIVEVPERIQILSKFLNTIFGIDHVVIESFSAAQAGSINSYDITMEMTSDFDIDFSKFG